jgi:hypothetical protein
MRHWEMQETRGMHGFPLSFHYGYREKTIVIHFNPLALSAPVRV